LQRVDAFRIVDFILGHFCSRFLAFLWHNNRPGGGPF
jgi:hypothetical protein